jgi:hypothetical protein
MPERDEYHHHDRPDDPEAVAPGTRCRRGLKNSQPS